MATILIIEDHALSRQMLNTWLGYTGHTILKAGSGEEALAIARQKIPDLIISDILMPGMDGFELVRRLRREKRLRRIPVIFYTAAYRQPQAIHLRELNETCRAIPKASEPSALLAAINEVLGPPPSMSTMPTPAVFPEEKAAANSVETIFCQGAGLRLAILMELSYNLVSERNPAALLEAFCRGARGFIDCQTALLAIEEEKTKSRYFWDKQQQVEGGDNIGQLLPPPVVLRQVVKERQPFRWPTTEDLTGGKGERRFGAYRSLLVVPVATPNKVYGWVALGNKRNGVLFTEEETEMIMCLSKQVALAYENLLLMQELQKNEKRLRLVLSTTGLCTWTWDLDADQFTYWRNGQVQEPVILTASEYFAAIDPRDRVQVYSRLKQAIRQGHAFEVEYRTLYEGREYWFLSKGLVNRVGKTATEVIGINLDITERKRMEEEAIASERELLKITLNSLEEGVIATDRNGRVMLLNCAALRMIGCREEEAFNQPLNQLLFVCDGKTGKKLTAFPPEDIPSDLILITRSFGKIPITLQNSPIRLPNGKEIGMVTVFQDITEKRQAERELIKTAKLESLGVLAAGIAHDFNNTLAAIISNLQLATLQYEKQIDISSTLAQMVEISHKASALTKQLLTFAKGGAPVKKNASLDRLIRETAEFVLRGSNIKVEYRIPTDLWNVSIDVGQISQVLHNLVLNAKQAMQHGGIIKINVENVEVGKDQRIKPGKYVQVTVVDQGVGIKPEIMGKIFDPFFTTKPNGNGLGLATAFSIIRQHDGAIEVESEVGAGSTFRIYLPASTETRVVEILEKEAAVTEERLRILLMDDEELICRAVAELLANFGHEIVTTRNGEETIQVYQEAKANDNPFDVVILDLTIPGGIGGKEVIARLRSFDPQIKAIVCSGYAADPIMADYQKYGFSGVVSKPYRIDELLAVLRQVAADL